MPVADDKVTIDKKIEYLIRASYSIINIVSYEEVRVEKALTEIAKNRSATKNKTIQCFFWSITKGLESAGGNDKPDLRDPIKILDYIMDTDIAGIFILRDFHPYLEDPVVIRKLRDSNRILKKSWKNIILLSPVFKIPQELEKEVAVIDYELPGKEELDHIVEKFMRSVDNPSQLNIHENEGLRNKVLEAALGLTAVEAENVFAKSLIQTKNFDIDIILSEKEQIIRKSGVLEYYRSSDGIESIGGLDNLKTWLRKRSLAFSKEAREFGLPQPRGILLIGIPGCGKSLTAKAISSLWKLPLLKLDVGKVFSSFVGSSEENVRRAIMTAESIAPSILWLDEIEKGFSGMQSSGVTDAGTTARVFGTFLTWLQEKKSPVFVVATSNNISQLPPELLRKGRFDEIFYIDLPNTDERNEIFGIHLEKRKRDVSKFDLEALSGMTRNYSGSEIEQIIISALYDAFDNEEDITDAYLKQSIGEMIPLSQTMEEEIKRIREWAKTRARKASLLGPVDEEEQIRKLEM
ncbi:MAG: AAA family ATPase [Spirochaetales bacterium]|nr:AAA family ATPase [Spirochaetales bacterium]